MRECVLTRAGALLACGALLSCGGAAFADGDIGVIIENGRLFTGEVDDDPSTTRQDVLNNPEQLFEGEFTPGIGITDDPGFFSPSDGDMVQGWTFGFNVRGALRSWTGSTFVTAAETMEIAFGNQSVVTPPGPGIVPGLSILISDPNGAFDWHPEYRLRDSGGDVGGAPIGAYLLELRLWVDDPDVQNSRLLWVLFNNGLDGPSFDEAEDYVRDNIVPSQGAAGLLALGAVVGLRRRR